MKKAIFTSAVLAVMSTAGAVQAAGNQANNTGQITFTGSVASASCDMNVVVNGTVQPGGVVDLGNWSINDVNKIGGFGDTVLIRLQPDLATCNTDLTGLTTAFVKIDSAMTASSNADVVTSTETSVTRVGVSFTLDDDTSIVNKPASTLDLASSANIEVSTGAIKFKARPYALSEGIVGGIIGGSVNYVVAYN